MDEEAIVLGANEDADEIFLWVVSPILDDFGQILEILERGLARRGDLDRVVHVSGGSNHRVGPLMKAFAIFSANPDHLCDENEG